MDEKEYITALYSQIYRVIESDEYMAELPLLLLAFDAAFLKRREFVTVRVAACLKRLLSILPLLSAERMLAVLGLVKIMAQR